MALLPIFSNFVLTRTIFRHYQKCFIGLVRLITVHDDLNPISTPRSVKFVTTNATNPKTLSIHEEYLSRLLISNLDIKKSDSQKIVLAHKGLLENSKENILALLRLYSQFNIDKSVIRNNLFLLELKPVSTKKKLEALSKINLKCISHGVPFLSMSSKKLLWFCYKIINEASIIPQGNRLYFLSDMLKVDPMELGQILAKRQFVYNIQFEHLKDTLTILLDKGVDPKNVIKDLWVLQYKPEMIKERLEKLHSIGRKKLMPWMVRCPEKVLERSISLTTVTKDLLGEKKSVLDYLAERLNCSHDVVNIMAVKIPTVRTVRVRKVKSTLDFLFSEGYHENDIIIVPRVLAHSVETMQQRLKELRSIGINPNNLNVLCYSKKDFEKYIMSKSKNSVNVDKELYEKEKESVSKQDDNFK